jgi:ribosomal protein L11
MDTDSHPHLKRSKKSDKAKKNYEKTGGFSQKHIRAVANLKEQEMRDKNKK